MTAMRLRNLALVVAALSAPGLAEAQESAAGEAAEGPEVPEVPTITLGEDIIIEGRVRKPEAFFLLRRTPFGYVIRTLDDDFLEEIVRATAREPF